MKQSIWEKVAITLFVIVSTSAGGIWFGNAITPDAKSVGRGTKWTSLGNTTRGGSPRLPGNPIVTGYTKSLSNLHQELTTYPAHQAGGNGTVSIMSRGTCSPAKETRLHLTIQVLKVCRILSVIADYNIHMNGQSLR